MTLLFSCKKIQFWN